MVEDESNGHDPFLEAMAMPGPATGDDGVLDSQPQCAQLDSLQYTLESLIGARTLYARSVMRGSFSRRGEMYAAAGIWLRSL